MYYKAIKNCKRSGCSTIYFYVGTIVDIEPENKLTKQWLKDGSIVPLTDTEIKELKLDA